MRIYNHKLNILNSSSYFGGDIANSALELLDTTGSDFLYGRYYDTKIADFVFSNKNATSKELYAFENSTIDFEKKYYPDVDIDTQPYYKVNISPSPGKTTGFIYPNDKGIIANFRSRIGFAYEECDIHTKSRIKTSNSKRFFIGDCLLAITSMYDDYPIPYVYLPIMIGSIYGLVQIIISRNGIETDSPITKLTPTAIILDECDYIKQFSETKSDRSHIVNIMSSDIFYKTTNSIVSLVSPYMKQAISCATKNSIRAAAFNEMANRQNLILCESADFGVF